MNNNIEEDIEFIDKMIKEYKTFGDLDNPEFEDTEKIYKAIESVLKDRERLEKALFTVIRNSKIMSTGLKLGKSEKEINVMSYKTMQEILNNMIDYKRAAEMFEQGKKGIKE